MDIVDRIISKDNTLKKSELYDIAGEYGVPILQSWTKDDLLHVLYQAFTEGESFTVCIPKGTRILFYRIEDGELTRVKTSDVEYNKECFGRIPTCPKKCKTMLYRETYPCKKQRTIFGNVKDYIQHENLKRGRSRIQAYPRKERKKRIEGVNE